MQSNAVLTYLVLFYDYQIEIVFQKIFRASRNVPLVKQAKLANTFVCLHSRLACFQRSNVRNYTARFGVSATHFCNAAKTSLTQETTKNML